MKLRSNSILLLVFSALAFACSKDKKYNPDDYLTPQEKDAFITTVIRYVAKAPEGASEADRFKPIYNSYYQDKASRVKLEQYYPKSGGVYFLVSQPAPSLFEKRHATGGRLKLNNKNELVEYEEVFRTWKMQPDTLKTRSYFLFNKMVKGESLESYYSKVTGDQYIEFPDERTYYDVTERKWKTK